MQSEDGYMNKRRHHNKKEVNRLLNAETMVQEGYGSVGAGIWGGGKYLEVYLNACFLIVGKESKKTLTVQNKLKR